MNEAGQMLAEQLVLEISKLDCMQALQAIAEAYPGQVACSSSFSCEDQVITHDICSQNLPIQIFTLDTGRLFAETYSVWAATNEKYKTSIKAYFPNQEELQDFVWTNGPNAFYESVEKRKQCCHIRKVEPLQRALAGYKVWVTGLRAEHSANRSNMLQVEWDSANRIVKYHPLLHWTSEQIQAYINKNNIPYNPLHQQGFVSIGCAPCTRAINPGEDFRAGRWWWEDAEKKECGLHVGHK
jgi:phosphoadenosine phosphosulfate reductase